jgi:hypothetical protein
MSWFKKIASDNYFYVINCVSSTAEDIGYMIDHANEVSFEEFLMNVNNEEFEEMEKAFGYPANEHLQRMNDDYTVSFWHSTFRGVDCYYFEHSRIEYVFTLNGQMGEDQDYDELV